jgi:cobalamin biosynthesis protein CbiD
MLVRVDLAAQAVTVEVDWIAFGDFADTAVMRGVEDNADVTANHQVTVELTASRTYEADYLGTIGVGLPDTVSPRVTRGGVSIQDRHRHQLRYHDFV